MSKKNSNQVSKKIRRIIKHPERYDWAGSDWFETKKLANKINKSIAKCDGKDKNPTAEQAVDFYSKVIELDGGKFFGWEYCTQVGGPGFALKRTGDIRVTIKAIENLMKFYDAAKAIPRNVSGGIVIRGRMFVPQVLKDENFQLDAFICYPQGYQMDEQDFVNRLATFVDTIKVNDNRFTAEAILNFYNYWFDQGYGYLLVDSFVTRGVGEVLKMYSDGFDKLHDDVQHMYMKLFCCPPEKVEN